MAMTNRGSVLAQGNWAKRDIYRVLGMDIGKLKLGWVVLYRLANAPHAAAMQLHMHGLPEDVIVKVISDFVEERQAPEHPIRNYADGLLASYERTFAELFPVQYTRKYHLTTADNMSTDWLGPSGDRFRKRGRRCSDSFRSVCWVKHPSLRFVEDRRAVWRGKP